jgi:hypothetical protein
MELTRNPFRPAKPGSLMELVYQIDEAKKMGDAEADTALRDDSKLYAQLLVSLPGMEKIKVADAEELVKSIEGAKKPEDVETPPEVEKELKKLDEIGVTTLVAVASLMPKIMVLVGDGLDLVKRTIPGAGPNGEWVKNSNEAFLKVKAAKKVMKDAKDEYDSSKAKSSGSGERAQNMMMYKEALDPKEIAKTKKLKGAYNKTRKAYQDAKHEYDHTYGPKFFKSDKTWAEKGHQLHALYVKPILGLLKMLAYLPWPFPSWKAMRDPAKREKAANIIYGLIMVSIAGYGVWSHLGHAHGLMAYSEIATEVADGSLAVGEAAESAIQMAGLAAEAT